MVYGIHKGGCGGKTLLEAADVVAYGSAPYGPPQPVAPLQVA